MAFSIFSKPQPVPVSNGHSAARSAARNQPAKGSGKVAALIDIQARKGGPLSRFSVTRYGTATERARAASIEKPKPSIELGPAGLGFSPSLENAALLFASGQPAAARKILASALVHEPESRVSPLAWHAQFDLLQRARDRAAFDQLALEYVAAFERSPPPWDDSQQLPAAAKAVAPGTGYFALTNLTAKAALELPARAARYSTLRIDVATLTAFEDTGCRRLVDILRRLRRQSYSVGWQGIEALWRQINERIKPGSALNEGLWLFALELLQWQNNQAEFEERAINYAVTFEVSPPSWEPLARKQEQAAVAAIPAADAHMFKGVLTGPADIQISALYDFAEPRQLVNIDMAQVERFDFVCAGALQNAVSNFDANEKEVQIVRASPIIQALLVLIGVKPESFAR